MGKGLQSGAGAAAVTMKWPQETGGVADALNELLEPVQTSGWRDSVTSGGGLGSGALGRVGRTEGSPGGQWLPPAPPCRGIPHTLSVPSPGEKPEDGPSQAPLQPWHSHATRALPTTDGTLVWTERPEGQTAWQ